MRQATNLSKAFRALRKEGYVAKQNFMCCQSCAWAELSEGEAEKAVFYHNQDYQDLKRGDDLYLAWSGDGNLIAETLIKNGMTISWDGTADTRIIVRSFSII